jgi:hypothetical protein
LKPDIFRLRKPTRGVVRAADRALGLVEAYKIDDYDFRVATRGGVAVVRNNGSYTDFLAHL